MRRFLAACGAALLVATAAVSQEDHEVRLGPVTARGGLAAAAARRVVRQHLNMLRFCYEMQLSMRPDLAGSVALEIAIAPTGAVSGARPHDDALSSPALESCLVDAAHRWTFPAPRGGGVATVDLSITFSVPGPSGGGRASGPRERR